MSSGLQIVPASQTASGTSQLILDDRLQEPARGSSIDVTQVGIYVGNGQMVDAPNIGAEVRVESFPTAVGASWGTDTYLGATSNDN